MTQPKNVLDLIKQEGIRVVDVRFMDFPGIWQHFTVPVSEMDEDSFEDGYGFDGSSLRGWQPINASDMLVVPDPATAKIDPFYEEKTLVLIGNIVDPVTREAYSRDPRHVAHKAENYLRQSGIGDTAFIGPEAEFFVFDNVRFPRRASGTPAATRNRTWPTSRGTRKATFRCRPWTRDRISGRR